ncbi:geranylgeranylglycerol-phosphate geranylgeranyltransferase [Flavisolibacter tropicus]|uniref:Ubiquinone biosynthesis protein UbiA n=1 Tax=Flavisolibacter tropicus TaxID=1492898 RepID=A0A172TR25_9BACT|nr:geranylgeranylglycerol-phosphate geranylgeranyltransferase [Flavisolibacter tropicus]ANE49521.1 ubiquinone biosynthesis protein UbiA [Flavisolibacter tropicus]
MRLIPAFFRLIRWQNGLFIILTQLLFYFCIYKSVNKTNESLHQITWLIIASVFIASAGYIINDYFDLNIDRINKPDKNVVDSVISRRWVILWHLLLSISGILATAIAVSFHKWYLILANVVCVILLWLYSTSFKRKLLIGNIVIALLTAWTILILFFAKVSFLAAFNSPDIETIKFFRVAFLYAGFAFIITIIREAIKDVEDMAGDRRYGCKTLPIVAGVTATKIYTAVWIVVLLSALVVLQLYILQFQWWWAILYLTLGVIIPLVYLFLQHYKAKSSQDFARLSSLTKWITLAGILSMVFFRIYL